MSGCPQVSGSLVSASHTHSQWDQRRIRVSGESGECGSECLHAQTKYRGLAEDEEGDKQNDKTDGAKNYQLLNKKLLDHFRHLAATNHDTDQVTFIR